MTDRIVLRFESIRSSFAPVADGVNLHSMADDEGASPPYSHHVDVLRGRWLWLLALVLAAVFTLSAWSEGELHTWTDGL